MLENEIRAYRMRLGWSQAELAGRSGISRAGVSAIETGRLVPSTAAALALSAALGSPVESLFRLRRADAGADDAGSWAWPAVSGSCRFWCAEVGGRRLLYPVEVSSLGLLPHDGMVRDGASFDHAQADPERTLVLGCCDPAVALLAAELMRRGGFRLIVLPRSSRLALDLLAKGLLHAAGVHLARSDQVEGNAAAIRAHLGTVAASGIQLLRVADWEEGIALAPGSRIGTVKAALGARLRWVDREPGSGARECLDEVLSGSTKRQLQHRRHQAHDHRGVAEAVRARWADAGICLRLTSEEAGLGFLSVRQEAYEIGFPSSMVHDPRLVALCEVIRSTEYRRMLGELPGYDTSRTGELRSIGTR
jgi:molybdate-binding protein/transcriptional regulator with XRE-family HTH domain